MGNFDSGLCSLLFISISYLNSHSKVKLNGKRLMEFTHPYRVGLVNINLSHGMRFEITDAREENNENRKKQQALSNNSIAAVRLL